MAHIPEEGRLQVVGLLGTAQGFLQFLAACPDLLHQTATPHHIDKKEDDGHADEPVDQRPGQSFVGRCLLLRTHQGGLRRHLVEVGTLRQSVDGVHLHIQSFHRGIAIEHIALHYVDAHHDE